MTTHSKQMKYFDDNKESVTANIPCWVRDSLKAGEDDEFFRTFRRSQIFLEVIEGTTINGGLWNLKRLLKDNNFLVSINEISKSEFFGSPLNLIEFSTKDGLAHHLNPTTIRYANNACNILSFFGNKILDLEVYEIGGGYGGECKVFQDISRSVFSKSISWNIYDLPSSKSLITKWLANFGYRINFKEINEKISSNSLVISCGALSEMRGDLLREYVYNVVLKCNYGYFITNFETHSKPFGGWSTNEFIKYLKKNGKNDVQLLDARSWLSHYDFDVGTRLIIFGTSSISNRKSVLDIFIYKIITKIRGIERRITQIWLI
jgi:hypothetical protein